MTNPKRLSIGDYIAEERYDALAAAMSECEHPNAVAPEEGSDLWTCPDCGADDGGWNVAAQRLVDAPVTSLPTKHLDRPITTPTDTTGPRRQGLPADQRRPTTRVEP